MRAWRSLRRGRWRYSPRLQGRFQQSSWRVSASSAESCSFDDDRVASSQGRRELPGCQHQGIVPRRDRADDTDRIAADHGGARTFSQVSPRLFPQPKVYKSPIATIWPARIVDSSPRKLNRFAWATMSISTVLYRTLLSGVSTGHRGTGPKNRPVSRSAAKRLNLRDSGDQFYDCSRGN